MDKLKIGFIGQGFVGKNYADAFEENGHKVVRYDIHNYKDNKELIKVCSLVLVAVPTPTKLGDFDDSALLDALSIVAPDTTVIIKSTIKIGTSQKIQNLFPQLTIMHSPEFLREKQASFDARNPERNIIGILDVKNKELVAKAEFIMKILPPAPYELITDAKNAELIKYASNCFLYTKVVFMNLIYDLSQKHNLDYDVILEAVGEDPRIGHSHTNIIDKFGRGAGGHCFIKDFEALIVMLTEAGLIEQKLMAEQIRNLNLRYLRESQKDLDLIKEVYGQ